MAHRGFSALRTLAPLLCVALFSVAASATHWGVQTSSSGAVTPDLEALQTSPHLCAAFEEHPTVGAPLADVERALSDLTDFWGIELDSILASAGRWGASSPCLCVLFVYASPEDMARELNRFDVSGASVWASSLPPYTPFDIPPVMRWQFPILTLTSGYRNVGWLTTVTRELVRALLMRTWQGTFVGQTPVEEYLLRNGLAEWSVRRLGGADRREADRASVARWLRDGGALDAVPYYLSLEVAASLVERWVRLAGAPSVWATCGVPCVLKRGTLTKLLLSDEPCEPADFPSAFFASAGVTWPQFVADWVVETQSASGAAFSEVLDRWKKDAFELRQVLLRPILQQETLAELDSIVQRVAAGRATAEDLDRAESLLQRAPEDGIDIDVEALASREDTLAWYALRVAEATNEMAAVRSASESARKSDRDPAEYARRFARVVNAHVPAAMRLPLSKYELPTG
ncbi:MAG: hypothetical protein PHU43_00040 [Candidatus Bipolaricaulis sp.]|nr:hypothetical protein [Candidatus Bipolaricaulis sp.]